MSPSELEARLAEQVAYYRAIAPEYEDHALPYVEPSAEELVIALRSFRPEGDVLELACGPTARARLVDCGSADRFARAVLLGIRGAY